MGEALGFVDVRTLGGAEYRTTKLKLTPDNAGLFARRTHHRTALKTHQCSWLIIDQDISYLEEVLIYHDHWYCLGISAG